MGDTIKGTVLSSGPARFPWSSSGPIDMTLTINNGNFLGWNVPAIAAVTYFDPYQNTEIFRTYYIGGGRTDQTQSFSQNGTLTGTTLVTTSATGLSITTQTDTSGSGVFDQTTTDVTLSNPDGSRTRTVTAYAGTATAGNDNHPLAMAA